MIAPGRAAALVILIACMGVTGACATRAQYRSGAVVKSGVRYAVPEPAGSGWKRIEVEGADSAWFHRATNAVIQANATCKEYRDAPLRVLTNQLLFGFDDRAVLGETPFTLDGRAALRTDMTARLDGVPRRLAVVVMNKDYCTYDLLLVVPEAAYPTVADVFDAVVAGFRVIERDRGGRPAAP